MASPAPASTHPAWQHSIALRVTQRDAREQAHDALIKDYQKLAQYAKSLRGRPSAGRPGVEAPPPAPTPSASSSASTSAQPPQPQATPASSKDLAAKDALISSLQSQLQTTRTELSDLYKSHTHLTTRLLTLSDQSASHSSLTTQLSLLTRREQDLRDSSAEKDKVIELLQDELRTLSLELGQVEEREERLKRDNAGLVKRWLERAREEVERVNVANEWVEEVQERRRREGHDAGNKEAGMGRETEGGGDKARGE